MKPFRITLIATGGTLEKSYDADTGQLSLSRPVIPELLARLKHPDVQVRLIRLMARDSLDMTDADRQRILDTVMRHAPEADAILVTHGTDSLHATGNLLAEHRPAPPVPVVLTGAMVPYLHDGSDALQNVAQALLACRLLAPGVHLVFHGQVIPGDRIRKDYQRSTFERAEDGE